MTNNCGKLHSVAFGLALGIVWGVGLFLTGLLAAATDWGDHFVQVMGSAYIGYGPTFLGAVIGGAWGFLDLFIAGALIAWLYNVISSCCCKVCGDRDKS